jgi:serine protease
MKIGCIVGLLLLLVSFHGFASDTVEIGSDSNLQYAIPATDDGELLVDFENEESPGHISDILKGFGIGDSNYSFFSREENWVRIRQAGSDLLDRLRRNEDVETVEPNYYYSALSVPNDPLYKHQWHLDLIGMKSAWDYPKGAPVVVAVIDTGIAYESFRDKFLVEDLGESQFVKPYNFVKGNTHANDDHGHGTHVAGTIAQLTNNSIGVAGVASNIKLMPLKVLNSYGYGTLSDIAAAIRYAADNGASVINMSLGGPFPSFILHKACKYAKEKGVVIVCAAGNSGRAGISYPANYSECLSVSAVRFDRHLTWYSSYGKGLTIAAPGGDMTVDQNGDGLMDGVLQNTLNPQDRSKQGYFLFQGTSMATPHVAAAAALLVSHGITDPDKVEKYLQDTATAVPDGSSEQYGAGVLNVDAALRSAFLFRNLKILGLAFICLITLLSFLNKNRLAGEKVSFNMGTALGLLFGSTGLFFLSKIPFAPDFFVLTHPVEQWPMLVLGAGILRSPVIVSALPAVIAAIFLYPWKPLTSMSVAFSIGLAAYLFFQAFSPSTEISWIPGQLLEFSWKLLNGFICLAIATVSSFRIK